MKNNRVILLLAVLLGAVPMFGQYADVLNHHYAPYEIINGHNLMQQRDGNLVANILVARGDYTIVGNRIYKVSRSDASFIDSLFIDDGVAPFYLMAQDPRGGNLRVNIEAEGEGNSVLRIARFSDDDLATDPAEDVVAPLYDGQVWDYPNGIQLSPEGDLIVRFYTFSENSGEQLFHYTRYGLDGTLKYALMNTSIPINETFAVFHDEPVEYFQWSAGSDRIIIDVMDSEFNIIDHFKIDTIVIPDTIPCEPGKDTVFLDTRTCRKLIVDGNDLVIASEYESHYFGQPYEEWEFGVVLMRFDKRKHTLKAIRFFEEDPLTRVLGLERAGDGCVYFVYLTDGQIVAMRLDALFNDQWCRYMASGWLLPEFSLALETNGNATGIAVSGLSEITVDEQDEPAIFVLIINDELWSVGESSPSVRPYACWPNPANDALHFQFSPDVRPVRVELYDLQGRMVKAQGSLFDSLGLEGLPSGTYLLRVALDDGTVFTDKVVKE